MKSKTALASVVTASVLEEFKFLKYSFDLFQEGEYQWFVRCDQVSLQALSGSPNIHCSKFTDRIDERPDIESKEFASIMLEKMKAMEAAWRGGDCNSVVYFDADIIITAPILPSVSAVDGDVVLSPNYYPEANKHLAAIHGSYNGGFVYTRTRRFHRWWQKRYKSRPSDWSDQVCLNDAPGEFNVGTLGEHANIGFWRSADIPQYDAIPPDCKFLHVHLFQPLRTTRQWIDKTFALHCMKFLRQGVVAEHHKIFSEVLIRDQSRWYEASLRLC